MLHINEVSISLIKPKDGLIGFASLIVNDAIFLSGISIHRKLDGSGYRLTYPTRKTGNRDFDVFHPICHAASKAIEDAILAKLKNVMNRLEHDRHHRSDPA